MDDTEYRCNDTVDLEEIIEYDSIRATAIYHSGRREVIEGPLKKDKNPHQSFSKKVDALRDFPMVKDVKLERFRKDG